MVAMWTAAFEGDKVKARRSVMLDPCGAVGLGLNVHEDVTR